MDVICILDSTGIYRCTNFYVKFRLPTVDQAANLILGIGNYETRTPIQTKFLEAFPTATNGELYEMVKQDIRKMQQSINNEPELVDIYCNGKLCRNICAFIGDNLLLHFYDAMMNQYFLTPNQTILESLLLQTGKNSIKCVHRSTQTVKEFSLYLWDRSASLVVMDIDGTITKSDLTGYIQTVYMKMYTYIHDGVIEFLNHLVNRYQYHIVYLTARPMAHRSMTSDFLRQSRTEEGLTLPEGPLLTSTDRISVALYREVILKDSAITKSNVLTQIVTAFQSAGDNRISPFVLGVGNKEHDAFAYNSAGVSNDRILLIDNSSKIQVWKYSQNDSSPSSSRDSTNNSRQVTPNRRKRDGGSGSGFPFSLSRSNSGRAASPYRSASPLPIVPAPTPVASTASSTAVNSRANSKDRGDSICSTPSNIENRKVLGSSLPTIKSEEAMDVIPLKTDPNSSNNLNDTTRRSDLWKESDGNNDHTPAQTEASITAGEVPPPAPPLVYSFQTFKDPHLYRYLDYLATNHSSI